ncbi:MAG: hypothetical protein ACI9B2_001294 [Flavobacteriales bacterium]|jgi:hypothetical protein
MQKKYSTVKEFYPFYLSEHSNSTSRILHFIGTGLVITLVLYLLVSQNWNLIYLLPLVGYGFAWIGHFFFEKNKPATFQYPLYSFCSDFILFKDLLFGRQKFFVEKEETRP